jgi:excisionase family DNA binding protein
MRPSAVRSEVREVMDIRQASAYLGISPDSLYKYASEGLIPAFKLGNRWRFKKSRIDEWMDNQSSASLAAVQPISVSGRQRKPVRAAR